MIASDLAYPYVGGGESYVIQLSQALIAAGHEVHWLSSKIPNTNSYENYQDIHIHRVPIILPKKYVFPGRQSFAFTSISKAVNLAKNMDVLQFNTFVAGVPGWLVGKLSRKPTLLFCHEMFNNLWKKVGRNLVERIVYPKIEKAIAKSPYDWFACPSEYSKRTLIEAGASANEISVLPHGVNTEMFNKGVKSDLRKKLKLQNNELFGFSGRLSIGDVGHSKNLFGLLKAAKIVIKELPNSKLVLGGKDFDNISLVVRKFGLEKSVVLAGHRPYNEVPKFIKLCDTVVCPALADGYCFLVAEASACGVPVVATNVGSHPERIEHGKTGILTGTKPEDIADGIIKVLSDDKLASKLGRKAAEHYKNLNWKNVAKKYIKLYEGLLK